MCLIGTRHSERPVFRCTAYRKTLVFREKLASQNTVYQRDESVEHIVRREKLFSSYILYSTQLFCVWTYTDALRISVQKQNRRKLTFSFRPQGYGLPNPKLPFKVSWNCHFLFKIVSGKNVIGIKVTEKKSHILIGKNITGKERSQYLIHL